MSARILVIEDNDANLYLMTYLLESFGHATQVARDGQTGLTLAAGSGVDLIICDIQLPKIGGYDVAREVRRRPALAAVPLVAVTALAMVGDQERILAAGFDGYISKPIAPETFVHQVEAFVAPGLRSPSYRADSAPHAWVSRSPARVRGHVLAVDDVAVNLALMCGMLEPVGYRVSTAGDLGEALACTRRDPPDIVITDLHMPGGSGYDLLLALKRDPALAAIPVMLISATAQTDAEIARGLACGARKFVLRPIDPERFLAEVEDCLSA